MKGGVLEVLLVSGDGLKNACLLGSPSKYVVIQCGSETCTSKISSGKDKKAWWNEKFTFKLPSSEWRNMSQLKLRIMEKDKFMEDCSVGEATVHLRGLLREGSRKGCIELKPAPYNVVLLDGTYEGEIKIGLKFISNVEVEMQSEGRVCTLCRTPEKQPQPVYRTILNLTLRRIRWPRFFFFQSHSNPTESRKDK